MERKYEVGDHVIYVDKYGVRRPAVVTIWWHGEQTIREYLSDSGEPGCNLVIVSPDSTKTDPYGRQIERETSVVHKTKQVAHGNFWCWPDE